MISNRADASMLIKAILSLKTSEECAAFLEDVLTIKETRDIVQRLDVAKCLSENMKYSDISVSTGASSATISRVNRAYVYGSGGYQIILDRLFGGESQ